MNLASRCATVILTSKIQSGQYDVAYISQVIRAMDSSQSVGFITSHLTLGGQLRRDNKAGKICLFFLPLERVDKPSDI